jgi:hypothetical protein
MNLTSQVRFFFFVPEGNTSPTAEVWKHTDPSPSCHPCLAVRRVRAGNPSGHTVEMSHIQHKLGCQVCSVSDASCMWLWKVALTQCLISHLLKGHLPYSLVVRIKWGRWINGLDRAWQLHNWLLPLLLSDFLAGQSFLQAVLSLWSPKQFPCCSVYWEFLMWGWIDGFAQPAFLL